MAGIQAVVAIVGGAFILFISVFTAATLSELSVSGVANPGRCKFPVAVPFVALPNVCELLPLSPGAEASIAGVPVWTGR